MVTRVTLVLDNHHIVQHASAMAKETSPDLYERILARLPPATLHDSCNSVLRREMDDVSARLKEVAEAFGRLTEVETAVTQLQQDKEDRWRSASLMALIADTERVQAILSEQLIRLGHSKCPGIPNADAVSRRAGQLMLFTRNEFTMASLVTAVPGGASRPATFAD